MSETMDELIHKADVAFNEEKFPDAKEYVEQAFLQVSNEENNYIGTSSIKDETKEEKIAQWYSQCAYIFFKLSDYLKSLSCSWKAAAFSDKEELNPIERDLRWVKLLFVQPRDRLVNFHKTLCQFLSHDLDEAVQLAIKLCKWERCLKYDHTIHQIFILLRDKYALGPNQIWLNPGRRDAFLRMANATSI